MEADGVTNSCLGIHIGFELSIFLCIGPACRMSEWRLSKLHHQFQVQNRRLHSRARGSTAGEYDRLT
jgi:hypothetical protein